jgi:hypothetical protein
MQKTRHMHRGIYRRSLFLRRSSRRLIEMKTTLPILTALALLFLLFGPLGMTWSRDAGQLGSLTCYCCSGKAMCCAMVSCPKRAGDVDLQEEMGWCQETLASSAAGTVYFESADYHAEPSCSPASVYLKVPLKPPIRV